MRILVCGGRNFYDRVWLYSVLDDFAKQGYVECVIHGAATGADCIASTWAKQNGVPEVPFPAEWKKYGKAAGPIRNAEMLNNSRPDVVIAFPGGRGTENMMGLARKAGIDVMDLHTETRPAATLSCEPLRLKVRNESV